MSLKEFMIGLATNDDVKRHYADDPQATMVAAGLTEDEQAAFSSGDSLRVRSALGKPDNDCMSQTGAFVPAGSVVNLSGGGTIKVTKKSILLSTEDCLTEELSEVVAKAKRKAAAARKRKAGRKKTGRAAGRKARPKARSKR